MKNIPLFVALGLFVSSCEEQKQEAVTEPVPDTLVGDYEENEMDAAIAKARATTDDFLAVLAEGDADSFSVKAPITDDNGTEHFWITDVTFTEGVFTGLVGNDPGIVKNVEFGQSWSIKKDEISDWMYTRGEMIHGGYTIEPLLDDSPQSEALREKLVR